ncbi:hypothetical protein ACVWZW_007280 [Bradyrhizobium sp. F1.13.4]
MDTIPSLDPYELSDRYDREEGRVFLTGTQAIVRIALDQVRRDRAAGLNTAGFISGYRGSPLGGIDLELWRIQERLKRGPHRIPPRSERRSCRDCGARLTTGRDASRPRGRWRVRSLVWQGSRRRSLRRCAETRQCLRLVTAWRRSGGRWRRPWLRLVLDAAPVRRRFHELVHADAPPRKRQRISRIR